MKINEVEPSCGNVFADLQLPNADELKRKSDLVAEIYREIKRLGLNKKDAATRIGVTEHNFNKMMSAGFDEFSEEKLTDYLKRLMRSPITVRR